MSRRPCNFWNTPAGCRRGNACKFAHSTPGSSSGAPVSPPVRSPPRPNPVSPNRVTSQDPASPQCPAGVCREFWTTGQCKKEFSCRFRHTRPPSLDNTERPNPALASGIDAIAPFLSENGLAKMMGSGTDGFYPLNASSTHSPTAVHNSLGRFLRDNFRFNATFDIYAFLVLLTSASATDPAWVSKYFSG